MTNRLMKFQQNMNRLVGSIVAVSTFNTFYLQVCSSCSIRILCTKVMIRSRTLMRLLTVFVKNCSFSSCRSSWMVFSSEDPMSPINSVCYGVNL
jgi:hypothetical protein